MTEAAIKFGVDYPHTVSETNPIEYAHVVEAAGYDSLWCGEGTFMPMQRADPLVLLGAWSRETSRLKLGAGIIRLPLRNPFLLLQAATTVDILSGGRLILGVGTGGDRPIEFEALGLKLQERGRRTDEAIVMLKALWSGDGTSFQGRFYRFENASTEPKPVQRPHPPIWIGGRSRAAVRRAARLGDGFLPYLETPPYYQMALRELKSLANSFGRDPEAIEAGLALHVAVGKSHQDLHVPGFKWMNRLYSVSEEQFEKYCVHGPPEYVAERIGAFISAGVRHFVFIWALPPGNELGQVKLMAREVLPRVRALMGI